MKKYRYGRQERLRTPKSEAVMIRNWQNGLCPAGESMEVAYSPSTGAVASRWEDGDQKWRICNIFYPMYGREGEVKDWVSVGAAKPKRARAA